MLIKYYSRSLFLLLLILFAFDRVVGQSYIYADREMLFDASKEHMQVMLSPDGNTHVWRWGNGRVTLDVYDKQLHLVQNQVVSRRGERLLFTSFQHFYYVLMMEPKTTRLLCIKNNDVIDRTTDFNRIPLEEFPIAQIRQGGDMWLFIQYSTGADEEHNMMHVTAIDSNLHYINSVHLTLRYSIPKLRNLRLYALQNELLIMNSAIDEFAVKLTVHKLNILRGTVRSNAFLFEDELFVPQDVFPNKTGFVLQGQAYKPLSPPRRQTAYTYLLQLDSSLQQVGRYYTAREDSTLAKDAAYWYFPVSTTVLPNNQLLITDYQRYMNRKTKAFEISLRFNRLDSALALVNSTVQPSIDYNNYPALVFSNGPQVIVFYEEMIKTNISVIHRYRYGAGEDTDRILQLNPKNHYYLKSAIRTSETSFIMPYVRNYKLGLVRVNAPVED